MKIAIFIIVYLAVGVVFASIALVCTGINPRFVDYEDLAATAVLWPLYVAVTILGTLIVGVYSAVLVTYRKLRKEK